MATDVERVTPFATCHTARLPVQLKIIVCPPPAAILRQVNICPALLTDGAGTEKPIPAAGVNVKNLGKVVRVFPTPAVKFEIF